MWRLGAQSEWQSHREQITMGWEAELASRPLAEAALSGSR